MNDLQLSITVILSVFSSLTVVILSIAPLYKKLGELQGELQILKDKLYSLCRKIEKLGK